MQAQEQQERENQRKNSSFRAKRERVRGEMPPGVIGPTQEGGWRGQGAGPRHLAFWLGGGPHGQPQVPPGGFLPGNFEYIFFVIFWATSL